MSPFRLRAVEEIRAENDDLNKRINNGEFDFDPLKRDEFKDKLWVLRVCLDWSPEKLEKEIAETRKYSRDERFTQKFREKMRTRLYWFNWVTFEDDKE